MRSTISISATPGKVNIGAGGRSRDTARACLPSRRNAKTMASCEPMASPSGRRCETTTKRCRARMASAICAGVVSVAVVDMGCVRAPEVLLVSMVVGGLCGACSGGGPLRLLLVQVTQDLLDPVLVGDGLVEPELQFRHPAKLKTSAEMSPEERRGALERPRRVAPRPIVSHRRIEHPCQLQVGRYLDARQGNEADAGIVHGAAGQQLAELLANEVAHAVGSMSLGHSVFCLLNSRLPNSDFRSRTRCPSG